jgi:hypothetical protein
LEHLHERLETVKTHDFHVLELQPHKKDGGVFVRFAYNPHDDQNALETLQRDLRHEADKHGGLPSWSGLNYCNIWLVKGRPFIEVCFPKLDLLGENANDTGRICTDTHQE